MTWQDSIKPLSTDGLQSVFPEQANERRNATVGLDGERTLRRTTEHRRMVRLTQIRKATETLARLPEPDESVHAVMAGSFDGFCIVHAILDLAAPATIQALHICTLGFNRQNADELFAMLDDGRVGTADITVSHYFKSVDTDAFTYLHTGMEARGQRCAVLRVHAKVMLAELSDGRCLVWESSANLRSCKSVEVFVLTQSRPLLEFHRAWIRELIDRADTGKPQTLEPTP